ncbi:hypothetical protein GCM10017557_71570 [Streptomyces aurantiacus]|uniref:Uncharacterized protein n=1 Tax=Streptomyces aurantiacus TaxID=47760 RepID=A0A7G1PA81_9ACTN|nr:hypothetical protein GCM10017557_71570 [Streptomyces aurantiacus]
MVKRALRRILAARADAPYRPRRLVLATTPQQRGPPYTLTVLIVLVFGVLVAPTEERQARPTLTCWLAAYGGLPPAGAGGDAAWAEKKPRPR